MSNEERTERRRELEQFANAAGQPNQPTPGGHALVRATTGLADRVIGAQPVAVHRDEGRILLNLKALANAAGSDWFYRYPVKRKEGGQDWIEGPSIKLANNVARIFGNNAVEVREVDVGDAWTFYARFTDIETGFSMERAYRQRKSQQSMKTKDADRQQDIAYQIGQSKAIRNVIVNALGTYCDYAFEEARNSLVDKIGSDLEKWRKLTLEALARIGVETFRAEAVVGRAEKDWLAPDIAKIVALGKAVADGMATAEENFPAEAEQKPADKPPEPSTAQAPAASPPETKSGTQAEQKPEPQSAAAKAGTAPKTPAEYLQLVATKCAAMGPGQQGDLLAWYVSDQQRKIRNGAGMSQTDTAEGRKMVEQRAEELGA